MSAPPTCHDPQLEGLRQLAAELQAARYERDRELASARRGDPVPTLLTPSATLFEKLDPGLSEAASECLELCRGAPTPIALTALAIVYLKTLPENRRLELIAIVLEEVIR